jgi:hypothetical protein
VSASGVCDNQMADSGVKANRSEVMRASTRGLYLFLADARRPGQTRDVSACRIRRTEYSGGSVAVQDIAAANRVLPATERLNFGAELALMTLAGGGV